MTATTVDAAALRVRRLRRGFDGREVLRDLDLDIPPGQFVALLGASGGGKSTLLKILAGLDQPDGDAELTVPVHKAVAFQAPRLLPWKKVWQNVVLGLPGRADRSRALAALTEVGLAGHLDAWPKTLSGGEAQRVALARALVRTPQLLLLDEPFAALDALTRLKTQRLVRDLWARHGFTVLLVTHDVDESLLLADRILVLEDGRIGHYVTVDVPQPRTDPDPALRRQLLGWLGVQI
jgi:sulfonate transport system ATP-binding protein